MPAPSQSWSIDRRRNKPLAPAITRPGATIRHLAATIGLGAEPEQWPRWLSPLAGDMVLRADRQPVPLALVGVDDELAPDQPFTVPNRLAMVWTGDLGWFGRWAVRWRRDRDYLSWRGLQPHELIFDREGDTTPERLLADLASAANQKELHGLFVTGHGNPYAFGSRGDFRIWYSDLAQVLPYQLALVAINACQGGWSKKDCQTRGRPEDLECGGRDLLSSSPGARFHGVRRLMIPRILFLGMDTRHPSDLLRPGEQGTRR